MVTCGTGCLGILHYLVSGYGKIVPFALLQFRRVDDAYIGVDFVT